MSWEEVFEHKVIADKNYLNDKKQQEDIKNNLSNSCALASLYVQNHRVTGYLNEIEELGEIPEERVPVYSVKSCVITDQEQEAIELKRTQMSKVNDCFIFDRNIAMFFASTA